MSAPAIDVVSKLVARMIKSLPHLIAARLRPLTDAGVPDGASRSEARQPVAAKSVVILSIGACGNVWPARRTHNAWEWESTPLQKGEFAR